jgi:hypothetical protein
LSHFLPTHYFGLRALSEELEKTTKTFSELILKKISCLSKPLDENSEKNDSEFREFVNE